MTAGAIGRARPRVDAPMTDVLRWPLVGPFLKWRGSRSVLQAPLFLLAALMVWHGLFGPDLPPQNLATVGTWIHYRGLLVLVLLVAGNLFCMACPFMLPRAIARRLVRPVRHWPAWLRTKWLSMALLVAVLFCYELFDLWASPWWTAWLIVAYFAAALVVDALFANASFCKYVCPLGQFNFVASTVSPLELTVRNLDVCDGCATRDCINGTPDPDDPIRLRQRGCEMALFQPKKHGNMDCTLCLDCVYACPHDNIGLVTRLPGSELFDDPRRSGIGFFSERKDLAALVTLFTFGALINAFGMVSPVHAVIAWLQTLLGTTREAPALATLFTLVLVVEPVVLLGLAGFATKRLAGGPDRVLAVVAKFAYALVPVGFAIWISHYSWHLLTGILVIVPVMQQALGDLGLPAGVPLWGMRGLPAGSVLPLEFGLLTLGMLGSLLVAWRIAARQFAERTARAFAPWAILVAVLWAASIWLMQQPMEMRGIMMMMMGS